VWAWLTAHAPRVGFPTTSIAAAYGGDEAEEVNARTGCMGCPLASRDVALETVTKNPQWEYLSPLMELRGLWDELRFTRRYRLRKSGFEMTKSGLIAANCNRLGPLTMEAREYGMRRVLDIQARVNAKAVAQDRPEVDVLNGEEVARIQELIRANTWPAKWLGTEPTGDEQFERCFSDGSIQPLLGGAA
jgi:DNA sulfur modification protein DndC